MFWALKKSEKKGTGVRNIVFWISHRRVVGIIWFVSKADVVCYKSNVKQLYFSKQYNAYNLLGYVLVALRSDYNVEESLLFLSTFLQLNVIKMLTVQ